LILVQSGVSLNSNVKLPVPIEIFPPGILAKLNFVNTHDAASCSVVDALLIIATSVKKPPTLSRI
jgi:hypothetical protein